MKEMTAGISSEVIPESTAAACSCATRERLPVRKILMIGFAQPALAMDTFETMLDAEYSSLSTYLGRASSFAAIVPVPSSATSGEMAPAFTMRT